MIASLNTTPSDTRDSTKSLSLVEMYTVLHDINVLMCKTITKLEEKIDYKNQFKSKKLANKRMKCPLV